MYAEIEPPPGAADSEAVSYANPLQVIRTSLSFFAISASSSIMYSMTFSLGLNGLRSSSPIDLTAMRMISSSEMPVERCCFSRKYFPASIRVRFGISPTISVPVTLIPLSDAALQTSSKALCRGVTLMSVMFMDTCAIPYSSIYQPMALHPLRVPGIITVLPSASFTTLPVIGLPSLFGRPFSLTSNATALALRVEVVFRLKFTAIRKSLAPTLVAPLLAALSVNFPGPKSGALSGSAIFSGRASYSPALHTARFFLSGLYAAAS